MSSSTRITEAHIGRKITYDARQVFRIMGVDDKGAAVYNVTDSGTARAVWSHERLDMLFACGRAEWGDCMDDDGDSVVKAGW